jgi:hypothetical protein
MTVRATDDERKAVVAALRRHFVDGRLTVEEYADRVERVWTAPTREGVDGALHDLPLLPSSPVRPVRGRRHGEHQLPGESCRPTSERFRDPTTNRVMRVWVDVVDGSRHYVEEAF